MLSIICFFITLAFAAPLQKRLFNYDDNIIRGVNIGGWLVLEPYITPSLFEQFRTNPYNDDGIPVDEYHFCQQLGYDAAQQQLINHWSNFYQESDFQDIANKGFNLVRIPVGYWAFKTMQGDPYVTGVQEQYLDNAIEWASKYGLKVWVDLHGAAGSQNGFDNSGQRDALNFPNDDYNVQVTTDVINYLLNKYSQDEYLETVIGVELINEPLGPAIDMNKLKFNYYKPAYDYLRDTVQKPQNIIMHDAFQPYNYWDDFLTLDQGAWGVTVDHHHYQVFSGGELQRDINAHVSVACGWGSGVLNEAHWTVAGEWSAALTDCTKWLNGVGIGARYDGSFWKNGVGSSYIGSCANNEDINSWTEDRKQNTRRYIEAQLDAFELRGGWIFWCYKTETSIEWDASRLIEYGLFPQPMESRWYPNQCGFS
ncbi:Glucan 1,3-beta-glucosidase I/II [Nakaseomyces glabratus]|nr:Glucan 1,3-beta-glucosidase I/II [Nakaseomyces glabratus]KTB24262.1 Glucan 1,3-beta-glucosidase I/II [Nakaseomyces glabratus]